VQAGGHLGFDRRKGFPVPKADWTFSERRLSLLAEVGKAVTLGLLWWNGVEIARGQSATTGPRIELTPPRITLRSPTDRQQVVVTAVGRDGSTVDATRIARFETQPSAVAAVSESGVVTPIRAGRATLVVSVEGATTSIAVQVADVSKRPPISYRNDVVPILAKAGCNAGACHGNLNGKGGFHLSLRGDFPDFDLLALSRDQFGRRINSADPGRSLIVMKPTGQLPHEGGLRFAVDSIEAGIMRRWISEGIHDDHETAVKLKRIQVFPAERIQTTPRFSQQLAVIAEFADGTTRDVTRQAAYDVSDPTRVEVSPDGLVRANGPSEVVVSMRLLGARAVSRLAFLDDRPGFVWTNPPSNNLVDDHVFAKLKGLRINPSPVASDPVFLRRVYLDLIGRLPEPEESRAFLVDREPAKRSTLIDGLIDRPEFADFWALKWADLLRNEEMVMGGKGIWVFQRWLRDRIASDLPLDELARRIVSTTGSTWREPASSFHRTNRDPLTAAETVGQVFLGIRLQCARCHNHPFDIWTQDNYYGLAAYFANVSRKQISNLRRDRLDKHEINGDELVFLRGRPRIANPRTGKLLEPRPPYGQGSPGPDDRNVLDDLAQWLTVDNPQFTRNLANRIWFHLFGRGIVDPVDDFRDSNPPSIPPLLDTLAAELQANGMRLRPLVALIAKSRVYQLSATPNRDNREDVANFSHAAVRLVPAEVLLDAISQVLAVPQRIANAPRAIRTTQLPGVRTGGSFLRDFGKPERLLTCECERSEATTLAQAFQMINGDNIRQKLQSPTNRIAKLIDEGTGDPKILEELYLAALCRPPTQAESKAMSAHLQRADNRRAAWEDVSWAILNSKEFLLRH
jgi:hypothetical protein